MTRQQKILFYTTFFLLVVVGFWFFLFRGTNEWKVKQPVLSYVKPFSFTNQDGQTVTQAEYLGKYYITNYFFTTCTGVCPRMNGHMQEVYSRYKNNPHVLLLSHTCQPEVDSLPLLKAYQQDMKSDGKKWQFVTGNKLDLYKMARESYKIDDPANNVGSINDQFLHSQFLALVDPKGRVRGVYDGLKNKEMEMLYEDLDRLLSGESE